MFGKRVSFLKHFLRPLCSLLLRNTDKACLSGIKVHSQIGQLNWLAARTFLLSERANAEISRVLCLPVGFCYFMAYTEREKRITFGFTSNAWPFLWTPISGTKQRQTIIVLAELDSTKKPSKRTCRHNITRDAYTV